jgi:hypothetical protein
MAMNHSRPPYDLPTWLNVLGLFAFVALGTVAACLVLA